MIVFTFQFDNYKFYYENSQRLHPELNVRKMPEYLLYHVFETPKPEILKSFDEIKKDEVEEGIKIAKEQRKVYSA